jgi:hypothetical protein
LQADAERNSVLVRQWRRAVERAAPLSSGRGPGRTAVVPQRFAGAVAAIEAAADAVPWRWATPGGPADR